MRILALDLGTKTGFALFDNGAIASGTWLLATEKELDEQKAEKLDRCCDIRPLRLLTLIAKVGRVDWIFFEDVQFLSTQLQTQLWGGLRAIVSLEYSSTTHIRAVPVGTLKKFATGSGAAKKPDMAAVLIAQLPGRYEIRKTPKGRKFLFDFHLEREVDDNEVDAIHLLNFALKELNGTTTTNNSPK